MPRICPITKKKTLSGNNVSHSNRKTKRKFISNIQKVKVWDEKQNKTIKIKISTKGLKIINKLGLNKALSKYNGKKTKKN